MLTCLQMPYLGVSCSPLLSVESSDVNWKKKKSGGIKIICQSEARDFSAMAFITDHVNSLIDQWFPGKKNNCSILYIVLEFILEIIPVLEIIP